MTYKIKSNNSFYCFNLRFLNFNRKECNIEDIESNQMELFFQKKLTPASFGFFFFYGFGGFLNAIGVFISFWQIRGSFFSLGNAVIFMSFLCYSFGLLQFEIFFLTVDSQISSKFQVY